MKQLTGILFLTIISFQLMGQQDSKLTQSMFLAPIYNPGSVGHSDKICAGAAFRNQMMGFPGSPQLMTFSANMPFNLLGRTHGAGISLVRDQIALNNDFFAHLSYSYKIDIGSGTLGIGANIGVANQSLKTDQFNGVDRIDVIGDDAIPQNSESLFGFDMGLGLYYSTENMFVGLSTTHLNETSFDYPDELAEPGMVRHYHAIGGYTIQLSNPMLELMPFFMLQTDGKTNHIYLNTNIRYNKKFWGGVSYSVGGGASLLFGVELLNGVKVGYSYDVELSSLIKHNSGSHEITVRYCFDLSLDKSPQKYESIRFL